MDRSPSSAPFIGAAVPSLNCDFVKIEVSFFCPCTSVNKNSIMGIVVNIVAGSTEQQSSITVTGSLQHIITDTEVASFKIKDAQLKNAVAAYFGKKPTDAYLRSPTPWGDLYKTYGWEEVKCNLRVKRATLTGITSIPTILSTKPLANTSDVTGTFRTSITETVEDTVTTGWSMEEQLSFEQSIEYSAKFLGTGGSGTTTFGFSLTFGQNGSKSNTTTVGSSSEIEVVLEPGQSAVAKLTASRGELNARIVYEAYLTGKTAVNYEGSYNGHYFWALPIANVMSSGGIRNSIEVVEDIKVGYYSDGSIELTKPDAKVITRSVEGFYIPGVYMAQPGIDTRDAEDDSAKQEI